MSWQDVILARPPEKKAAAGGTFTLYPSSQSGYIESGSNSFDYSAARAGTGDSQSAIPGGSLYVGQNSVSDSYTSYKGVNESFIDFDLSGVSGTTCSAATLSLGLLFDQSISDDFTVEARNHNWGSTLTFADYVPGASLSGKTLLATLASSGIGSAGYKAMTESGTALRDAVTAALGGTLRIVLASDRTRLDLGPSGAEFLTFAEYNQPTKPKMEVTTS